MAEAEDVIVDAARHATAYAQELLRRRRSSHQPATLSLLDVAPRLDLLLLALHQRYWPLRVAQPPAPVTALKRIFRRSLRPWRDFPVPSTNGYAIWLPRELKDLAPDGALTLYRAMVLQQAQRAVLRDSTALIQLENPLQRDIYLVLEARVADAMLTNMLPGLQDAIRQLRIYALSQHPPIENFPPERRAPEVWLRGCLSAPIARQSASIEQLKDEALALSAPWLNHDASLFNDCWTGEWPGREGAATHIDPNDIPLQPDDQPIRSAHLARRPQVRQAEENEDDRQPGAWMIQTAQPHEHVEDPMGMQRPSDRDVDGAAEDYAESVSELAQARLVHSPQRSHEVLLSDDPPPTASVRLSSACMATAAIGIRYPEWDYRQQAYRDPGTTVWESMAEPGPAAWVERTLEAQRGMLSAIRRGFEMLRAQRLNLHRQEDGDDLDIEACIEARADLRAGASMSQRLYRATRLARRDTAVLVLVDVSGSTDAWVAGQRRIIDVEREALLPLSIALDSTGDPHAILAFSGEGPQQVLVRSVKRFDERHTDDVARRIAGLEPEHYTRAGAALRHASRMLAAQPARHRLLLLLSDGKPNDCDDYEGRYGVEDMRQAVLEARQSGQSLFCLTVDRQAANYLPRVFGPHHYALLQKPERLPMVLVDWMKRLLMR